jgi:hypothetical protein
VDAYGDNCITACTTGNMEATFRHDRLVDMLVLAARNAGCYAKAEDASFYRSAIPQAALDRLAAQAGPTATARFPVPDLVIKAGPNTGVEVIEVKVISKCNTWYPSGAYDGVARRESRLNNEYLAKARALDRKYGLAQPGTAPGSANLTIGPIESKYLSVAPVRGVVVGGFNEGSQGLYGLITDISAAAGRKAHVRLGLSVAAAAAHAKQLLISRIGTAMARGHAQLLVARLQFTAPLTAQRETGRAHHQSDILSVRAIESALVRRGCGMRVLGGGGAD